MNLLYDGTPVEFGHNVSYACADANLYYEHNRDLKHWNLKCLPDGSWLIPDVWPRCVASNILFKLIKSSR